MISVFRLTNTEDALIFKGEIYLFIIFVDCCFCLVFRLSVNFRCRATVQELAGLSDRRFLFNHALIQAVKKIKQ